MNIFSEILIKNIVPRNTQISSIKKLINKNYLNIILVNELIIKKDESVFLSGVIGSGEESFNFTAEIFDVFLYDKDILLIIFKHFSISPNWLKEFVNKALDGKYFFYIKDKYKAEFSIVKSLLQSPQKELILDDQLKNDIEQFNADRIKPEDFNEETFMAILRKYAIKIGGQLVEKALILFYCWQDPSTPSQDKAIIVAALVYLFSPVDAIPDVIPVIGYSDDLIAIVGAMKLVFKHIKEEHIEKARKLTTKIFGNYNEL